MVKLVKVRWDLRPPNIKDRLPPSAVTTRVVQKCERFDYSVVHKVAKRRKKKGGGKKKKVAGRKCPEVQSKEGETGDRSERLGPEVVSSVSRPAKESPQRRLSQCENEMEFNRRDKDKLHDQNATKDTAEGERNQENADASQSRRKQSTGDKHGARQLGPDKKSDFWKKPQEGEKSSKEILLQDNADKDEKGDQLNRDKNEKNQSKTETEQKGHQQRTEIKSAVRDKRKVSPDVKKLSKEKQDSKEQARDQLGQSLENNKETPEQRNKQSPDRKDSDCQDTISRSSRSRPEKGPTRINLCQKFSSTDTVPSPTAAPICSPNIGSPVLGLAKNNGNPGLGLAKNNGSPGLVVPAAVTSEEIDSELVDMASQLDYSGGFGDFDNDDSDSDEAVSTATSPRWRPPTFDPDTPTLIASTPTNNSLLPSINRGFNSSRRQILRLKWCGDGDGEVEAGGVILDLGEYTAQQLLLRAQRVREAAARHAEAETIEAKSPIICDLLRNDFLQLWLI
jgi:hypothetical protein